jgi:TonB family protein
MIKTAKVFLPAIFFFGFLQIAQAQDGEREMFERMRRSVVSVVSYNKQGDIIGQGVGFFVNEVGDLFARRRNFPTGTHKSEIKTIDGKAYPIIGVAQDYVEVDLIRVWVKAPMGIFKPLSGTQTVPTAGERVVVLTAAKAPEQGIIEGAITEIQESENGRMIRISGSLPEYSNGSPVINMRGDVIGIAIFLRPGEQSFAANGGEKIRDWAVEYMQGQKPINDPPRKRVMPNYPYGARPVGTQNTVRVQIVVNEKGDVAAARILSGHVLFHEPSIEAAYKWKFDPVIKDGKAVRFTGTIMFIFGQ